MKKMKVIAIIKNGKRKIHVTHTFSGVDKRKEAADVVLGNKKVL
ncbi:hypothetical protein [Clostridium culturomicium]